MNRKILIYVSALSGALMAAAQPMDVAAATPFPAAGTAPPNVISLPMMRMPQADPLMVRLVWQAIVAHFPEIVDGPERTGRFVVAIALRPDGSVVRSAMRYVEQVADMNAGQQALRDQLPADVRSVAGIGSTIQRKGAAVLDDRILKGDVILNAVMVPTNWDETRDSGIVRRAVLQKHADLFLPRSSDHINQLTVVMSENGDIAREKLESLTVEHQGTMSRTAGGCGLSMLPGDFARSGGSADRAAAAFAPLGLAQDQIGMAGMLSLSLPRSGPLPGAMPTVGADGIARGSMSAFEMPVLQVCYAWPRRPGEPVGGTPLAWDSIPQPDASQVTSQMTQMSRLVGQYFPAGSPTSGNWMLLTPKDEVIRTGHVELGKDEQLTNAYVQRLLPGIKVSGSMSMSHMGSAHPGDFPGPPIQVSIFVLAPDSPLPAAENILLPAK